MENLTLIEKTFEARKRFDEQEKEELKARIKKLEENICQ